MADSSLLTFLALVASVLGFAWIALALPAHWRQVHGARILTSRTQAALRACGAVALMLGLALCLWADAAAMAVLLWMLLLPAAGLLVALALHRRPALLRRLWRVGG